MSSYLVLARKYRPRTFEEVVGQDVVKSVLMGALKEGRIGHAYLFTGPRGTGKTTTARILAKCLNCEQGPTPTPCGTCERCVGTDAGSEVDIIEIDAASHTGVDNIRELRDEAVYAPMRARHKVYIVDEVHMLSKAAFNALLKTLEEPPPHVVFLFATTEPHKVLDTILSRCQILRLTTLTEEQIAGHLDKVLRAEKVTPEDGVTLELARRARGGVRDALSLSDKLLALAGGEPTLEDLHRLGGEGGAREVSRLCDLVEQGDAPGVLGALAAFTGDEGDLTEGLLEHLRTAAVLAHCGADTPLVPATGSERKQALSRGARLGAERIELWMQELLRARERMRLLAGQERLILELTLLDLCHLGTTLPLSVLVQRLEALEARIQAGAPANAPASTDRAPGLRPATPAPLDSTSSGSASSGSASSGSASSGGASSGGASSGGASSGGAKPSPAPAKAAPRAAVSEVDLWSAFLAELGAKHGSLAATLQRACGPQALRKLSPDSYALTLGRMSEKETRLVDDRRNRIACSRALSRVTGQTLEVQIRLPQEAASPEAATSPTVPHESAPLTTSEKRVGDPLTKEVADLFGGVIEDLS